MSDLEYRRAGLVRQAFNFARFLFQPVRNGNWNPVAVLAWILVGLLWWIQSAANAEARECAKVGGQMIQTGVRTMMVYNAATKTAIPQQVSIRECIVRQRIQ